MSVTITQSPQAYMPAFNPIFYQGIGAAYASVGYFYYITVRDMITGATSDLSYRVNKRPDGYFLFDASPFAQQYITNSCIINEYGVKVIPCVRQIRVTVAEYNDDNPLGGAPIDSTDYTFYAWNGVVTALEYPTYDYETYIMDGTHSPRFSFLTDQLPEITFEDRSNLFYYLSEPNAKDCKQFYIETYDSSGTPITNSTIANSNYSSTNYLNKYIGIDLGHKGLTEITAGAVTGTYPIISAATASYRVTMQIDSVLDPSSTVIKTYTIKCTPKFPVYTIHALFANGHFRTIHFNKVSDETITKQATSYKQIPFENNTNVWEYSQHSSGERTLSVSEDTVLKLRTDWLTIEECLLYKQLVTSPICYLDLGSATGYTAVIPLANTYKIHKAHNDWYYMEMDFKYTLTNYKQRG
jgi:hypothetical protein